MSDNNNGNTPSPAPSGMSMSAIEALIAARGDLDLASARIAGGDKEEFARQLINSSLGDMQDAAKMIVLAHLCQVIEAYAFSAIKVVDDLEPIHVARQLRNFLDSAYLFTKREDSNSNTERYTQMDALRAAFSSRQNIEVN